ncbi:MAG: DNA repair protein RecO [Allobaculum sp.]|uniref:DNA repair protein RecO n=1 Tax=Allobaculum sp. TaxID=1872463 RepID=UPI00399B2EA7
MEEENQFFESGEARIQSRQGLVLSTMDYKDNDGLITMADENGIFKVYAKGVQKETSKNRRLFLPFSLTRIAYDPKYSRDFLFLINGQVIESYWKNSSSLEYQCINQILTSLILRHDSTPEIYYDLHSFWQKAQEGEIADARLAACKTMIEILHEAGVLMNVDECTVCSRTDRIAGVSIETGGFVCLDHLGEHQPWPKADLMLLRRLTRYPLEKLYRQDLRPQDDQFLLWLMEWYQYTTDSRLRSLDLLKQLIEMGDRKKDKTSSNQCHSVFRIKQ